MPNEFKARPEVADFGREYEELNVANIILKAVVNNYVKDFTLSKDDDSFGKFDDIVLETMCIGNINNIKNTNINHYYAMQLKHNNNSRTLQEISLVQDNGEFAIAKYLPSYKKICEFSSRNCYKLILFTSRKFDKPNESPLNFEKQQFSVQITREHNVDKLINSSKVSGKCYKFTNFQITDGNSLSKEQQEYKHFFENFFLYTDQENAFHMKTNMCNRFQKAFSCSESEFNRYLQFISGWTKQTGKKEKLNKHQMKRVITFSVLSDLIKPISFVSINSEMKLLQKAISEFNVTIFEEDSCSLVCQIWSDKKHKLENKVDEVNRLRTAFQFSFKQVKELSDLSDENCSQLLWLMGICPLIVSASSSTTQVIKLCPQEKFVLLGIQKIDQLRESFVFQNLSDLYFKSEVRYKDIISSCKYSLQGKKQLTLECLIEENEDFRERIIPDDILKMFRETYIVGGRKESFDFPYIDRSLTLNLIKFEYLKEIDKDTIIVIDCLPHYYKTYEWLRNFNLVKVEKFLQKQSPSADSKLMNNITKIEVIYSTFKQNLYFTEGICSEEKFKAICEEKTVKKQHHLRLNNNGHLQWIRSLSDIDDLRPFRTEKDFVKETELYPFENKIILIIGEPGMGKSVFLRSLKNKIPPMYWTIIFYTEDITSILNYKHAHDDMSTTDILQNYILKEKFNMDNFEKYLLLLFMQTNHVVYAWDGLDELSTNDITLISNIIGELYKKDIYQLITCRCHLKNFFEQKFEVFSNTIIQFSEEQQSIYIHERLIKNNYSDEDIKNTLQQIKKLMIHHEILGIPLQIFMLTELFRKNPKKYSTLFNDLFNSIDLYQYFIDEKFNIYYKKIFEDNHKNIHYREKAKQVIKDTTIKKYQKAALKTLVPSLFKESNECSKFLEEIREKGDEIGIITEVTSDNVPFFIHKSFAEYLVAVYFVEDYKSNNSSKSFKNILFETVNRNIRFFFDLLLAKNSPAHLAVLYKNFDFLQEYDDELKYVKDLGQRSVLHVACSWGQEYPSFKIENQNGAYTIDTSGENKYLILKEDSKYVKIVQYLLDICSPLEQDELYNYDSLTYAEKSKSFFTKTIIRQKQNQKFSEFGDDMASILYYSAKFGYEDVIKLYNVFPCIKTRDGFTYLHLAVCQKNFFFELLKMQVYKQMIDNTDACGLTALSEACRVGQYEIVEYLTNSNANINLRCHLGQTPLHYASKFGHKKIVQWLINYGAAFNADKKNWTPLHWACHNGHTKVVDVLLNNNVEADMANDEGYTPLHLACINGNHNIVQHLLKSYVKVNIHRKVNNPKELDWTPLHAACRSGHENVVKVLLDSEVEIDRTMKNGRTALHYASENGHLKAVQLLCKYSPRMNLAADEGLTPLHFASDNGNYAIVELLITFGSDVNVTDSEGWTPLHFAASKGHNKIMDFLIDKGADIESKTNNGRRPIHCASEFGKVKSVKLLLKSHCQIDATDENGLTSLHLSCMEKKKETVMVLLKKGADVNFVTKSGKTALYFSCQKGNYEIVATLLQRQANLNKGDNRGIKPIHVACYNGHETVVNLLIAETNVNVSTNNGWTPIHYACRGGHIEIVRTLISAGTSINSKCNRYGYTALHVACQNGDDKIASLLLKSKADVNTLSNSGQTPLHVACENNHHKIARSLISSKANINSGNEEKYTPLHLACEKGHVDTINLLISLGANMNAATVIGWTCLHLTGMNGNIDVCQRLLKTTNHPDFIDAVDHDKKTTFYLASQYGHEAICNLLIKCKANISIKADDGTTALHVACQYNKNKIVQLILNSIQTKELDINVFDYEGCTPLHISCEFGHEEVVKLLLNAGAKVHVYTKKDKTPLNLALDNGHQTVVTLLSRKVCCSITW